MKKILFLVTIFSLNAFSQIISPNTVKVADRWFPTPRSFLNFIAAVNPSDVNDIKDFIKKSNINMDRPFPVTTLEDNKLILSGLSTPILWNKDGSFSFKNVNFKYDKNISFKKNLASFDRQWGQFREFAAWSKKTSAFEFLVLPQAHADDSDSGIRSTMLKWAEYSYLGIRDSIFKGDKKVNSKISQITCDFGDDMRYHQYGYNIRIAKNILNPKNHDSSIYAYITCDSDNDPFCSQSAVEFNVVKDSDGQLKLISLDNAGRDDEKKEEKGHKHHKKEEKDRAEKRADTQRYIRQESAQTLISVCASKTEKQFNKASQATAQYAESNHFDEEAPLAAAPATPAAAMDPQGYK